MKNFRHYEKGQRQPANPYRHAPVIVEWPSDPEEFCCQSEAEGWACTLLTDFPHTVHEAAVMGEIAATWEDE